VTLCPICAVPEGTLLAEGARAGALVLMGVTLTVLVPLGVFAVRLWRAERQECQRTASAVPPDSGRAASTSSMGRSCAGRSLAGQASPQLRGAP
jgi:hypothetical protein